MTGKQHAAFALAITAASAVSSTVLYATGHEEVALGVVGGALTGYILTPDIDVNTMTYEEARMYRVFWLLGVVWTSLWTPYATAFSHRGWSHTPIIGTLTRLAYILLVSTLIIWISRVPGLNPYALAEYAYYNPTVSISWFLLWACQDIVHYICDISSTAWKKSQRRKATK